MNDQISLEKGWKNEPLKELYPTQAHKNHPTKWLEMLVNVLRMIRDVNGIPLAAVIRKRLTSPPDNEDMAFGLRQSKYISHNDEMIERAPILDSKGYDRTATDKNLEKTGPFDPRYRAAHSLVWSQRSGRNRRRTHNCQVHGDGWIGLYRGYPITNREHYCVVRKEY